VDGVDRVDGVDSVDELDRGEAPIAVLPIGAER
jgi:hypothetical protein